MTTTKRPPQPPQRPAEGGDRKPAENPRATAQLRKVLGKHYANRYGKRRG